jgi:hypothetical protein
MSWNRTPPQLWDRARVDFLLTADARKAWARLDELCARRLEVAVELSEAHNADERAAVIEEHALAREAIRRGLATPERDRVEAVRERARRLRIEIAEIDGVVGEHVETLRRLLVAEQPRMFVEALDRANGLAQDAPWRERVDAAELVAWTASVDHSLGPPVPGARGECERAEAVLDSAPHNALVQAAEQGASLVRHLPEPVQ